jgi:ethanolamine utilization protein EutN
VRIARVVGNAIATIKHPALVGHKLLLVEEEDPDSGARGRLLLAVDTVDAGEGDRVLLLDEGNSAAQVLRAPRGPVRTVIVGVIDQVETTPDS